jgi:hypothetical protein
MEVVSQLPTPNGQLVGLIIWVGTKTVWQSITTKGVLIGTITFAMHFIVSYAKHRKTIAILIIIQGRESLFNTQNILGIYVYIQSKLNEKYKTTEHAIYGNTMSTLNYRLAFLLSLLKR